MFIFDEKTIEAILKGFENKELASNDTVVGPGGRIRKTSKPDDKEEPCSRPGCIHWQPPPPCVWDAPCKADCFETPPGIQPGRNPLTHGKQGHGVPKESAGSQERRQNREIMKLLTPDCCAGCSTSGGGTSSSGGPAPGLPVLVMKLC
jgi:hypothetical protein